MAAADNSVKILPSPDVLSEAIASDYIGSAHHQLVKMEWGPDGTANETDDVLGKRFPTQAARASTTGSCSVAAGATVPAAAIDCRGYDPTDIIIPAEFDGTTINFQVSTDNANFFQLNDSTNVQVTMIVTASRAYPLWGELSGWPYIKVCAGTNQATTATVFTVVLRS